MSQNAFQSAVTDIPPRPYEPRIMFVATEYRVPLDGEWFWADGDQSPSVCRMFDGMDVGYHNNGKRWILVRK